MRDTDDSIQNVCTRTDMQAALRRCCPELSEVRNDVRLDGRILYCGKSPYCSESDHARFNIVNSGCLKQSTVDPAGDSHINDFLFTGDAFGIQPLGASSTLTNTSAYDSTFVVSTSISSLPGLARTQLYASIQSLARLQVQSFIVATKAASIRFAWLLEHLRLRPKTVKGCVEIYPPMPRSDIANYIGLAAKTVSRELTSTSQRKITYVENRMVRILDLVSLRRFVYVDSVNDVAA